MARAVRAWTIGRRASLCHKSVAGGVLRVVTDEDQIANSKNVTLNSVNGNIVLTIPTNANADLRANTLHGAITNDFGLLINDRETVGHDLSGQLGSGGTRVHLSNVNGQIAIKRD